MHYLDKGKRKKEVLVLIHGLGSKKESWEPQFELSNRYRLVIPDVRGFGESDETDDINVQRFAKDIWELLDELKVERAHFCGISMGGVITQEIYRQQPDRVLSLILSNTLSYSPMFGKMFFNSRLKTMNKISNDDYCYLAAKKCLYHKNPELMEEAKKSFLYKPEAYIDAAQSTLKANYLYLLPFVHVPTLIIGSMYDEVVPVFCARQMKFFMPRADIVIFKQESEKMD